MLVDEIWLWMSITMIFVTIYLGVFLFIIMIKTPAWTLLKASLKKRTLLINPQKNRFLAIIPVKKEGSMGYVKGKGFYHIDQQDTYIEEKTRCPVAITYDNYAMSIDVKDAKIAEKLSELGFKGYSEICSFITALKAKGEDMVFSLLGETVNINNIIKFLAVNERSDLIESEIQRRTAAMAVKKMSGDLMKWAVVLCIIFIGGAIAFAIITSMGGGGGGAAAPIIDTGQRVITGTGIA